MIAVDRWTGEEALLLRSVMRASVREFAGRLGISPRTVSNWQRNKASVCRPQMAQILDTALFQCTPAEQEAFSLRLAALRGTSGSLNAELAARPAPCTVVSHKFLPVYLGERSTPLHAAGSPSEPGPGGLAQRVLPADHHSAQSSTVHIYDCGVAVVHLEEHHRLETLTDLALWRYHTYLKEPRWVGERMASLLARHGHDKKQSAQSLVPQYVLSAYELRTHTWSNTGLDTALQLLATPSVLVNRQNPANVVPLGPGVEEAKFRDGWAHPEAVTFDGGVSRGVVGWSGVAYHPQRDEKALTMSQIVALEVDVQALWALSSHILHMIEDGQDPVMPTPYGWRFLRSAYFRLTTARPTETAQHRVMREAILATSELPDRLRAAQDALRDSNP
ncbi:helix-turn-helix domain-containing protein [Streptomyces microflavus]|uniref:Transcriptional regulator n=1 Tax=Streptomyces microflavus TaxID=1919 RepID=A0A7J0D6S8_STRMI|nr:MULTISPECIES: helix-turn-helix transcriptional regulator [Streptomyces]MDX2981611.1 XRE family transcriptional regulator [Streptomyces sp. NRRL_B-2249]GFN09775.1 transcriptional regulator [Streptomyces microflavus]GGX94704.1 transcriptional regulator [Streptomyces microflavus]